MAINLKNYTTEVPADRLINCIEKLLVDYGATNIMKEFDAGGRCSGISFLVVMEQMKLPFRLPGKVGEVFAWLKEKRPKSNANTLWQQAERITWKNMHEWIHLQLSLIEQGQMEPLEAFLPHLYEIEAQKTFYNRLKEGQWKGLLPGSR